MIGPDWVELVGGPYDGVIFDANTGATTTVEFGYVEVDAADLPLRYHLIGDDRVILSGTLGDALYVQTTERRWIYEPPALW